MKKVFVYAGEKPMANDGIVKPEITLKATLLPPRYVLEIGERIVKCNDVAIPEEQQVYTSFINGDTDNAELMRRINDGNCVTHCRNYISMETNEERSVVRYGIPYKDPDASCFKETTKEPIMDAMNVQTDAKCEVHCILEDDTDYVRDVIIPVKTAGCGALNLFDIMGDIEDDIETMLEEEKDGFAYDEDGELSVLFFHKETGESCPVCFTSMGEFLQTVVSVRLVDVENHIHYRQH